MSLDRTHEDVHPFQRESWGVCEGRAENCTVEACRDGAPLCGTRGKVGRDGNRRVKGCGDPSARGTRNKRKGQRKQAKAVTGLGIPRSSLHPGHEEFLGGTVRVEVKAGAQVRPVATRFLSAEAQSEAARAVGDHRPTCVVAMPDGMSDGIVMTRLSTLHEFCAAICEQWGADEKESD